MVGEEGPRIQGVKDLMNQGDKGMFSKNFINDVRTLLTSRLKCLNCLNLLNKLRRP
jgi:hypothetical protein